MCSESATGLAFKPHIVPRILDEERVLLVTEVGGPYLLKGKIYAQIATISRTTALFDDRGVEASGQERYIAGTFCDRAAARVADQFDRIDDNDDTQTHAIARLAYNRGGYTPRLH